MLKLERAPGQGWIALLGGGEFTFGETIEADEAWLGKTEPGPIGFLPAASGSTDYGQHFAEYMKEQFDRQAEVIPIYRGRDARRAKNSERVQGSAAVYIGGGIADQLISTVNASPALKALEELINRGGTLVAIAAAAQALGEVARSFPGRDLTSGLGVLPGGAVETNFDVAGASERRLRQMMAHPGVRWGLGIGPGGAVLLGPNDEQWVVGEVYALSSADADLAPLEETENTQAPPA